MKIVLEDKNYHPTGRELAEEILQMEDVNQLQLLEYLYQIPRQYNLLMQLQYMRDAMIEDGTYEDVKKLVILLYEYLVGEV